MSNNEIARSSIEAVILRHADKWEKDKIPLISPRGSHETQQLKSGLSIEGIHDAKNFAQELFKEIKEEGKPSFYFLMPSNVSRARETAEIIAAELNSLLTQSDGVELLTFKEVNTQSSLDEKSNYIVIPGHKQAGELITTGSPLLGYYMDEVQGSSLQKEQAEQDNCANEAWERIKNLLEGDRIEAFKVWLAGRDEWKGLKESLKEKFSHIPPEQIDALNQGEMGIAPEEWAMRPWKWLNGMKEMLVKKFPERSIKYIGISHDDISDFVTYVALGYPLNAGTLDHFESLRDYLEPSHFRWQGDELEVSYRGETRRLNNEEIQQLPAKIEKSEAERLEWWKEMHWL